MLPIIIGVVVFVVVVLALAIMIVKKQWYLQLLLAVAAIGSVLCGGLGVRRLTGAEHPLSDQIIGTILLGLGLAFLLATISTSKVLRKAA